MEYRIYLRLTIFVICVIRATSVTSVSPESPDSRKATTSGHTTTPIKALVTTMKAPSTYHQYSEREREGEREERRRERERE